MRESYASLLSQTANGAVDLMVAALPQDVMQHAVDDEPAHPPATRKDIPNTDAPWENQLHKICPHRLHHPRTHLIAVVGLLVTGALVIYITALHMGYLTSAEAAFLSSYPILLGASPPMYNSDSIFSPAGEAALDATNNATDSSQVLDTDVRAPPPTHEASPPMYTNNSGSSFAPAGEPGLGFTNNATDSSQVVDTDVRAPPPITQEAVTVARIYYQNMSETWHRMSDKQLLRKASSVQPLRGASHVARIAYLFIARGPLPFAPLWERYFRGHDRMFNIYIHGHPDYVPTVAPTSPFFRRFIPSQVVKWGALSVYEAERRLLGNALLEPTNEWFVLLSESCIPIFNFLDTYIYLNHSQLSFIQSFENSSRQSRLYRGNYKAMRPEITRRNFRKGSQWFQVNRDLARKAAADSKEYTKFEKYFCHIHPTCYIDEHFLPTLAAILRPHAIAYRTLTYFEFRGTSPHPKMFARNNTNENLILEFREGHNCTYNGQATSKCHLFVRKFDPDALDILLDLAGPVMAMP